MLTDAQRAEVDSIERSGVGAYERGVLLALRRSATGSDRRRIDGLVEQAPRPEPVFTGDRDRYAAGVERATGRRD